MKFFLAVVLAVTMELQLGAKIFQILFFSFKCHWVFQGKAVAD